MTAADVFAAVDAAAREAFGDELYSVTVSEQVVRYKHLDRLMAHVYVCVQDRHNAVVASSGPAYNWDPEGALARALSGLDAYRRARKEAA